MIAFPHLCSRSGVNGCAGRHNARARHKPAPQGIFSSRFVRKQFDGIASPHYAVAHTYA